MDLDEALQDKHLQLFLRCVQQFQTQFCEAIHRGNDFTIRLEVNGDKGEINHCRVQSDRFERPGPCEK